MSEVFEVKWPDYYQPARCPVHVRNELDMAASPAQVWAWLARADLWPSWYVNAARVTFREGPHPELKIGTSFRWKTFGVRIHSKVLECVAGERMAWDAKSLGVDAYHAWVLQPSEKGCRVLTEETQHGWLAWLSNLLMPKRMQHFHQIWLEALEKKAREGFPPPDEKSFR